MCALLLQEHWATALKTLTLTLDEVVHIRSVLTKAELESLPLDGDLKDDVAKGKVSRASIQSISLLSHSIVSLSGLL